MKRTTALKWQILVLSTFVFLLAQGFSSFLGILSYHQSLTDSILSSNLVIGLNFQYQLERGLRFGKEIDNFFGIERLMKNIQQENSMFKRVDVYLPDGAPIYSTISAPGQKIPLAPFPAHLLENISTQKAVNTAEGYTLLYPAKNRKGNIEAIGSILLDSRDINKELKGVVTNSLEKMLIIIGSALIIIRFAISRFIRVAGKGNFPRKQIFLLLFFIMIGGQLLYSGFSASSLRNEYLDIIGLEASAITSQVKTSIEKSLKKGTSLEKLDRRDFMLNSVLESAELVQTIVITDAEGKPLNSLERIQGIGDISAFTKIISWMESRFSDLRYERALPLINNGKQDQPVEGFLRITLSREHIHNKLKDFVLDSITVLLVAILLVTEIMLFLQAFFLYHDNTAVAKNISHEGHAFVRTATSMFLFGFMMSVSFVPLHINSLPGAEGLWGLSSEVIQSLPLSIEFLCALISVLTSGYWLDRRGWHEPFIIGILICSAGTLISGYATTPLVYIHSRGLAGLGYGFTWMSAQGYILSDPDVKERTSALSSLIAGIFIGFICGNVVGAMLADHIGFAAVFQLSTIFIILPLVFIILFMRRHYRQPAIAIEQTAAISLKELITFLKDRRVIATLLFSVIPISLCQLGLVQFIAPVYLFSIGVSQADIGRAIMIYGLMLVYIAPVMSRYLDRSQQHKLFIIMGGFIGGIGLIQVHFLSGYISILIAIILMGLAACFMISAQSIFILGPAASSNISPGVAVSIQRTATKLGQVIGPLIFSALLVTYQMEKGLMIMGIYFAVATLAFFLFTIGRAK